MIYKTRMLRKTICKNCNIDIVAGEICFKTTSSGFYDHTICMKCVAKEINKVLPHSTPIMRTRRLDTVDKNGKNRKRK